MVKQHTLKNSDDVFDVLIENELCAAHSQVLLKSSGKRHEYLVTGFLTTTGTLWTGTEARSRTAEVSATVPVSQIVGAGIPLPGLADPTIEPSHSAKIPISGDIYRRRRNLCGIIYFAALSESSTAFIGVHPISPRRRARLELRNGQTFVSWPLAMIMQERRIRMSKTVP